MRKIFISILAAFAVLILAGCTLQKEKVSDKAVPEKTNEVKTVDDTAEPLIGGQTDEYGCLGPAGYSWCVPKQKCLRVWEEPCLEDANFDTNLIKQAFLKKYPDWEGKELDITVNKQYGDHVAGGVNFAGSDAGGGYFFGAKTEDGWVIAADGNGEIRCDGIDPYNFPSDMIPECFDTETQTIKNRAE